MRDRYLEELGLNLGMGYDENRDALHGVFGYHVDICAGAADGNEAEQQILYVVSRVGTPPDRNALDKEIKNSKAIRSVGGQGYALAVNVKKSAWSRKKTVANIRTALEEISGFLCSNGYEDCCQRCGQPIPTISYLINGRYFHLCADCYRTFMDREEWENFKRQKKEHVVAGLVGALLGSLAGVLVMVLLDQLGYVAALSGLVMAVCTLKGYELLGGKLGRLGTALSVGIMIAMVYVGNQVTWGLAFYHELKDYMDVTFFDCFRSVTELLDLLGDEAWSSYNSGLAQQYLFVALGAVPTIVTSRKNQKLRHTVRPMGGPEL